MVFAKWSLLNGLCGKIEIYDFLALALTTRPPRGVSSKLFCFAYIFDSKEFFSHFGYFF
jgi:hypothetical protein